ncbi:MAG: hypothetical protein ACE5DI_04435 [Candidatus Micrarchaeia archaeon]
MKAQHSLEFIFVATAYFAFASLLLVATSNVSKANLQKGEFFTVKTQLENACLLIDLFSNNARFASMKMTEVEKYKSSGKAIYKNTSSKTAKASCKTRIQTRDGLDVERRKETVV